MQFVSVLRKAKLIRRYKRFLADVQTDSSEMTIHCPNTGSMKNCGEPGWDIWYSTANNAKRKYPCTWEVAVNPAGDFILVNTAQANRLVAEALKNNVIEALRGYHKITPEVAFGEERSRLDFLLSGHEKGDPDCVVEVKSVTLLEDDGAGFFPDAVTLRGQKHLRELIAAVQQGLRGVLFFCVNHTGIHNVAPAAHIDPAYAQLLQFALAQGVEVYAYGIEVRSDSTGLTGVELTHPIPVVSSGESASGGL